MEEYIQSRIADVNAAIKKALPEQYSPDSVDTPRWQCDYNALTNAIALPLWDLLNRGGKRWRPILMELCCEAVGGTREDIAPLLAVPELLHNGTLVVDDLEDNSLMRRGDKALHIKYGNDVAINAGNALYYIPLNIIAQCDDALRLKLHDAIGQEMYLLHLGQAMDIHWHATHTNPTQDEYLQMCACKTGVLARLSARMGCCVGNATDEQVRVLSRFAESLGVAFQIIDDVLNITADLGKTNGDDITEGKRSLLVLRTLERASEEDKKELLEILERGTTEVSEIQAAIAIIQKYDSVEYAYGVARSLIEESVGDVRSILSESDAKNHLLSFAEYVIARTR